MVCCIAAATAGLVVDHKTCRSQPAGDEAISSHRINFIASMLPQRCFPRFLICIKAGSTRED